MILLIDNYDSFVYNLARYLEELGCETRVVRNDSVGVDEIRDGSALGASPDAIVLSPGPGEPSRAGICLDVVRRLGAETPVLGVCLGHQAIGAAYGARIVRGRPVHGRGSKIHHDGLGVFSGLSSPFTGARYHSLVIDPESLPRELVVSARTEDGAIMAVRHRSHPVVGVQFHPESVLSDHGHRILGNFLGLRPAAAPVSGSRSA